MISNISFVHVGLPKTGSTWLQKTFFPEHDEIQILGMASRFTKFRPFNPVIKYLYSSNFSSETFNEKFNKYEGLIENNKMIGVSDESLSGFPIDIDNAFYTPNNIKSVFGDVKVIIILRNPISFLNSAYIQSIRSGKTTVNLESFFDDKNTRAKLVERLDYKKLLKVYKELFSSVLVLPFELFLDDRETYLSIICDFLEIEKKSYPQESKNSAIPELIQFLMRKTNVLDMKLFPKTRPISRYFWPRIYELNLPLKKSSKVGLQFFKNYDEFKILKASNYNFWSDSLSKYNYLS